MSDGIQRIAGITGLNPISEHELFKDGKPITEIGNLAYGLAKGAVQDKRRVQEEALMLSRMEGLTFEEAFNRIRAQKKQESIEDGYSGFLGIACMIAMIPAMLLVSIFSEE